MVGEVEVYGMIGTIALFGMGLGVIITKFLLDPEGKAKIQNVVFKKNLGLAEIHLKSHKNITRIIDFSNPDFTYNNGTYLISEPERGLKNGLPFLTYAEGHPEPINPYLDAYYVKGVDGELVKQDDGKYVYLKDVATAKDMQDIAVQMRQSYMTLVAIAINKATQEIKKKIDLILLGVFLVAILAGGAIAVTMMQGQGVTETHALAAQVLNKTAALCLKMGC